MEILRWAATTDPVVKSVLEDSAGNASYLSHDIQNELINIGLIKCVKKFHVW